LTNWGTVSAAVLSLAVLLLADFLFSYQDQPMRPPPMMASQAHMGRGPMRWVKVPLMPPPPLEGALRAGAAGCSLTRPPPTAG
jgi:hypothetical protein